MLTKLSERQIKHIVDRFLGWRVPSNFSPDAGIKYTPARQLPGIDRRPFGTNLLDAQQAEAMVRYIADGMPDDSDFRWLIEAPGARYLAVQRLKQSDNFVWTTDHNQALAFRTQEQADALMMAIRQMDREINGFGKEHLFSFETTLGNAKAVEHGWMA